ncbi:hypothetical protein [Corynebacterium pygosceleis]|uniref:hypothetical protein n=1 Tax=Corynebacterium pygosceleis TaxID=2800406 RepID=UPI0020033759|nr:hypothetical protein [Corynebacterium pygosceleis]MCK7676356.1 hypothetical protein [Corynebacterium pygosceleis]
MQKILVYRVGSDTPDTYLDCGVDLDEGALIIFDAGSEAVAGYAPGVWLSFLKEE